MAFNPTVPAKLHADGGQVRVAEVAKDTDMERDEITQLVMRLKRADERQRTPRVGAAAPSPVAAEWAANWQLPREVHDYFMLEVR
jgi:hypothetical protein